MMNTPLMQSPYLREQRQFPNDDVKTLANQCDHAYIDIASKVNARTIGLYALNFPVITGEKWFFAGQPKPQQSLRQIYMFTGAMSIPHGLEWPSVAMISPLSYGTYTDGTNWYGAIYASSVPIAGQYSFYVTRTIQGPPIIPGNIVVIAGAGAPTITTGTIVLEYISNF